MPARRLLMRAGTVPPRGDPGLRRRGGDGQPLSAAGAEYGLGWPLPADLDDAALEDRVRPDCAHIHRELKRDGVTLQLL